MRKRAGIVSRAEKRQLFGGNGLSVRNMAQFTYKARRRTGEVVEGNLDVADRSAAVMQIEKLGLLPVAVTAARGSTIAKAERAAKTKETRAGLMPPALREIFSRQRKPKLQELATFTQQLANLIKSGMPLTVALNSMTHLATKGFRRMWRNSSSRT
jgi:general secretion pathway protein F